MQQFIRCARTGNLYPISRIARIQPPRQGAYWRVLSIEDEDWVAEIYDHEVDELRATYVPAIAGQKVIEVCYHKGEGQELWSFERPVIAWRILEGEVRPIGPEGKIADTDDTVWLMQNSDGSLTDDWGTCWDTLEMALAGVKGDFERRAKRRG